MSDLREIEEQNKAALEKGRQAVQRKRSLDRTATQRKRLPFLVGAIALSGALMWASREEGPAVLPQPIAGESHTCAPSDASCLGRTHISAAQAPCSHAIAQLIQFEPQWTDSFFERRFDNPTWYVPGESIIYTGRQLLVQNAFGAKERVQYFCVVKSSDGRLLNAGIPDLDARVRP